MMNLLTLVVDAAIVLTIASFFTGVQICFKIYTRKSTADYSAFPFLAGVLCSLLWLRYGIYVDDGTMIGVNLLGLICQTLYLVFYYYYTLNKATITKQISILALLIASILWTLKQLEPNDSVNICGILACTASLLFCAAPLASIGDVLRTKSTEKMPFWLILSSFCVTSLWFLYGYLISDAFVQVPNGIGSVISAFQLSLFIKYPSRAESQKVKDK